MNIHEFAIGDIITRNEPCEYPNKIKDGSYTGEKIELLGVDKDSKIIFLKTEHFDSPVTLSYARDQWDEGWCKYPTSLYESVIEFFKK